MRKPLIAGNWKMHGSRESVAILLKGIRQHSQSLSNIEMAVFPPFIFLPQTQELLDGSDIQWGAQNVNQHSSGAFTGEISLSMLQDFACQYVILGHSERRSYFHEDNAYVAEKFAATQTAGLTPILCIGETLEQQQSGETQQILDAQIDAVLALDTGINGFENAVIAYEPVWAIGTGVSASPEQAQEVHAFIRAKLSNINAGIAESLRIVYGGSVKSSNVAELLAMSDIDGGLIGGASLDAQEFNKIGQICNNLYS